MNILIVEDNADMLRTICAFTGDLVDNVFECSDGCEAFAFYAAHLPDWVLMDIEMKIVDGISATREIIEAFPSAKIAIVTAYDDNDLREIAFAAGACEYIVKDNLIDLRRLLAR